MPEEQVREHIVYIIWGGVDKLKAVAAKAKGEKSILLSNLYRLQ
ncbi:hypothetical protein HMPREF0083_04082 [Aneurinibacillus aneurinilyticus ATCC 12856]|uniref:Uncharacterized protein n=1 Tax=Aneurinibacillus aneurinilyticus ATCC 12856 TaxID=649747 RepID=U1WYR9_ANEAE|nr:hypothetical protein HMPREF0083_04082 [Aneurinibacillus aneurinilyticus ATCC 12856]